MLFFPTTRRTSKNTRLISSHTTDTWQGGSHSCVFVPFLLLDYGLMAGFCFFANTSYHIYYCIYNKYYRMMSFLSTTRTTTRSFVSSSLTPTLLLRLVVIGIILIKPITMTTTTPNLVPSTMTRTSDDDRMAPWTRLLLDDLKRKYYYQPVFLQAVEEMALSLSSNDDQQKQLLDRHLLLQAFQRLTEPERVIAFQVPWEDDQGKLHFNRGWRVEFSSALGPYKGGLRFHPTVDEGILKSLAFEQTFKNALTGLPLGGGKGGSDFDPKHKSNAEIRRFCQSFITQLYRYLHPSTDVPAGDIGVGGTEIGYMYGQYKTLANRHGEGVLTGKSLNFGGSHIRTEATGYGLVYMAEIAVQRKLPKSVSSSSVSPLQGMRCALSGSGNVAQYAAQKLIQKQAKVVTLSDSNGVLYFPHGMTAHDLEQVMECKKQNGNRRLHELVGSLASPHTYTAGKSPWQLVSSSSFQQVGEGEETSSSISYDLALPCATQNEIDKEDMQRMIQNGLKGLLEGANLPTTLEAQQVLREAPGVFYVPGKASNAGGVGVSGLEMSQNAQRMQWKPEDVDQKLQEMMKNIYDSMEAYGEKEGGTLEMGANRAGFLKVATAMKELGWIH